MVSQKDDERSPAASCSGSLLSFHDRCPMALKHPDFIVLIACPQRCRTLEMGLIFNSCCVEGRDHGAVWAWASRGRSSSWHCSARIWYAHVFRSNAPIMKGLNIPDFFESQMFVNEHTLFLSPYASCSSLEMSEVQGFVPFVPAT